MTVCESLEAAISKSLDHFLLTRTFWQLIRFYSGNLWHLSTAFFGRYHPSLKSKPNMVILGAYGRLTALILLFLLKK